MEKQKLDTVLCWFRRDLRVDDNTALMAALEGAHTVIPVFIWAPEEEGQFQPGRCSRWWYKNSLLDLESQLKALGSKLIIRRATESSKALLEVAAEVGACAVYFNNLYDPISLVRDHEVKHKLTKAGITCHSSNSDLLYEPWEVLDEQQQAYTTFKSFWAKVTSMSYPPAFPAAAPTSLPAVPEQLASLTVQQLDWFFTPEQEASSEQLKFKWQPGVAGAVSRLEAFLSGKLQEFDHHKAKVDRDSTSVLSPWIHMGSISVRYMFYKVQQKHNDWLAAGDDRSQACADFLQQLGYREYSRYLSFHFPFLHERSLLSHLRALPVQLDQFAFKAWRQGQTGYPLVDAAMKQLWSTGWCHNRVRVVASSFAVKHLLLPWQWGLKHLWDAQIDADLECDSLGWQYVSGGMADAKPFSFMYDIAKESKHFDPDGEYVRRWLPVLSRLPNEYIHAPWLAPPSVLEAADIELGFNYPAPIVSEEDALRNVAAACRTLEQSMAAQPEPGSEKSTRQVYRLPAPGEPKGSWGLPDTYTAGTLSGSQVAPKPSGPYQAARLDIAALLAQQRELRDASKRLQISHNSSGAGPGQKVPAAKKPKTVDEEHEAEPGPWKGKQRYWDDPDEDEPDDDVVSEEVVSNTCGLSAYQPSGFSGFAARRAASHAQTLIAPSHVDETNGAEEDEVVGRHQDDSHADDMDADMAAPPHSARYANAPAVADHYPRDTDMGSPDLDAHVLAQHGLSPNEDMRQPVKAVGLAGRKHGLDESVDNLAGEGVRQVLGEFVGGSRKGNVSGSLGESERATGMMEALIKRAKNVSDGTDPVDAAPYSL